MQRKSPQQILGNFLCRVHRPGVGAGFEALGSTDPGAEMGLVMGFLLDGLSQSNWIL